MKKLSKLSICCRMLSSWPNIDEGGRGEENGEERCVSAEKSKNS